MSESNKLHILWTTGEIYTAINMVMLYSTNSMLRGWWDEVTVIIWGESAQLAAHNEAVQKEMEIAKKAGVKFEACMTCAVRLGVVEKLESMGVKVISWGPPLTELLLGSEKLITI